MAGTPSLVNRGSLPQVVEEELEQFSTKLKGLWLVEHNEDGTHNIDPDSLPDHEHNAADITSGELDAARIPNLDASKIATGTLDAARIPNLDASKIATGTMSTARLGSGSANNTKFLRGDSTWQTPPSFDASSVWPVGSIFISVVSTNPATLLGFGTWAAFATGRTIVGIDAGQTEFNTVKETGGAKTHTLSINEMPQHNHSGSTVAITDPGHKHSIETVGFNEGTGALRRRLAETPPGTQTDGDPINTNTTGITATLTIANQGGGAAHNNLQPYIVVYMWERTA